MGLVSLVAALRTLADARLPLDLYFVATTGEEVGILGALRAAEVLKPDVCIALDTSPVAHGFPVVLDGRPVIWYGEAAFHNKTECDILNAAGSDAGHIKRHGLAGRTVAFGYARDNSHGYEIAHQDSLKNVTDLLVAYLKQLR